MVEECPECGVAVEFDVLILGVDTIQCGTEQKCLSCSNTLRFISFVSSSSARHFVLRDAGVGSIKALRPDIQFEKLV